MVLPEVPELLCQAFCWWCHCPVQAVDGAHVTGMQAECAVAAGSREQGPPLCTHDPSHLHIICSQAGGVGAITCHVVSQCEQAQHSTVDIAHQGRAQWRARVSSFAGNTVFVDRSGFANQNL